MALPDIQPIISVASEGINDDCSVDTDNPFGLLSGQDDFVEALSITAPPTDEPPVPPTEIDEFAMPALVNFPMLKKWSSINSRMILIQAYSLRALQMNCAPYGSVISSKIASSLSSRKISPLNTTVCDFLCK